MEDVSNSIVEAKKQYTQQLIDILTPFIYQGLKSILQTCKTDSKVLRTFQEKLCSVPKWNQDIIDREYNRIIIEHDNDFLEKLIEAVFISNVKVLSTIRVGRNKPINIKVPEAKTFLHKCYVECARYIYQDPYLMDDRETHLSFAEIQRNIKRSQIAINTCIDKTIRDLIPIQSILENYLNDIDTEGQGGGENEGEGHGEHGEDGGQEGGEDITGDKDELDSIKGTEELGPNPNGDYYPREQLDDNGERTSPSDEAIFNKEPDLNVSGGTSIEDTPATTYGSGGNDN